MQACNSCQLFGDITKYSGATNNEIGVLFGGLSYSAVTKIAQSFSMQMAEDKELQGRIRRVVEQFSVFKIP